MRVILLLLKKVLLGVPKFYFVGARILLCTALYEIVTFFVEKNVELYLTLGTTFARLCKYSVYDNKP